MSNRGSYVADKKKENIGQSSWHTSVYVCAKTHSYSMKDHVKASRKNMLIPYWCEVWGALMGKTATVDLSRGGP